jgi:hypothetical protein
VPIEETSRIIWSARRGVPVVPLQSYGADSDAGGRAVGPRFKLTANLLTKASHCRANAMATLTK